MISAQTISEENERSFVAEDCGSRVLTWDGERGSGLDDPAVGPYAVSARRCGLHFETYFPVWRIL